MKTVEAPKGWECVNPECRVPWVGWYDFDNRSPLCLNCQDDGLAIEYTMLFIKLPPDRLLSEPELFYCYERAGP